MTLHGTVTSVEEVILTFFGGEGSEDRAYAVAGSINGTLFGFSQKVFEL